MIEAYPLYWPDGRARTPSHRRDAEPVGQQDLVVRFRSLRSERHPDNGGTVDAFHELTSAYEAAQKEIA